MQWQDVGMTQTRGDVDLAQEALAAQYCSELGLEQLECHLAAVAHVVGQIDRGHAAGTKLLLDDVAVGECRLEAFQQVFH
jgi:hypothetical protein